MPKIEIYSTPKCPFCEKAKNFFKQEGLEYKEYDVATDKEKRKELIEKSKQMGVPVIIIDGKVLVGFIKYDISKALGII